jgi:hypothetical protein
MLGTPSIRRYSPPLPRCGTGVVVSDNPSGADNQQERLSSSSWRLGPRDRRPRVRQGAVASMPPRDVPTARVRRTDPVPSRAGGPRPSAADGVAPSLGEELRILRGHTQGSVLGANG